MLSTVFSAVFLFNLSNKNVNTLIAQELSRLLPVLIHSQWT